MKRSPLKRKTPLKRGGPLKRSGGLKRSPIRWKPKVRTDADPAHLAWVRKQPCCVCQTTRHVEAHHPRVGTGMSLKAPDREAFPMCFRHHQLEFHQNRGFFAGWTRAQRHEFQRRMSAIYAPGEQTV